jgi:CheY-like chemotaxis protein
MTAPTERSPERVVLVVDDEKMLRQMTARILQDAGFRVLEADDGEEAVALLAALGPDIVCLVVSDIAMPCMTGTELAKTMSERWPSIPVLLISGQSMPSADYRGGFLQKPFLPDALVAAARALLGAPGGLDGGHENVPVRARFGFPWWDPRLPVA